MMSTPNYPSITIHNQEIGIKQTVLFIGGAVILGHGIWYLRTRLHEKKLKPPNDSVILHQIPRAKFIPSISYHSLKIETFLRMANIPYINEFGFIRSPRGNIPWLDYKGQIIGDAQTAIEHFSVLKSINLNPQFSDRDKAIALAFRILTENHLYWVLREFRWILTGINPLLDLMDYPGQGCKRVIIWIYSKFALKPRFARESRLHGIGKFNAAQILSFGENDLRALSSFLGGKSFMMGEQPTELDCCTFPMLAQILYSDDKNPYSPMLENDMQNLVAYCARMKKRFWTDWDICCTSDNLTPDKG